MTFDSSVMDNCAFQLNCASQKNRDRHENTLSTLPFPWSVPHEVNKNWARSMLINLVKLLLLVVLFWSALTSFEVDAMPLDSETDRIGSVFGTQDKICSTNYAENERSYQKIAGTFTGVDLSDLSLQSKFYTGFKLHRIYHFGNRFSNVKRYLKMYYCKEGKVQWETSVPQKSEINWELPICFYDSPKMPSKQSTHFKVPQFFKKKQNNLPIDHESMKEQAMNDLNNFACFKIARRKIYTQRSFSIYLPNTWIGGVFYCDLSLELKKVIIENMDDNLQQRTFEGMDFCNRNNSIPLQPLIADNYLKHWTELKKNSKIPKLRRVLGLDMDKVVPFLYTPNVGKRAFNFSTVRTTNFTAASETEWKMPWAYQLSQLLHRQNGKNPWFNEIEVQEHYMLNEKRSKRTKFISDNILEHTGSLLDSKVVSNVIPWDIDKEITRDRKILKKMGFKVNKIVSSIRINKLALLKRMNISEKILSLTGSNSVNIKIWRELNNLWWKSDLTEETFEYEELANSI